MALNKQWPAIMSKSVKTLINATEHFPDTQWYAWSSSVESYAAYETIIDAKCIFQTDNDGANKMMEIYKSKRSNIDNIGCIVDIDDDFKKTEAFKTLVSQHRNAKLTLFINQEHTAAPVYCKRICDQI